MKIIDKLEYVFFNELLTLINISKNTKVAKFFIDVHNNSFSKIKEEKLKSLSEKCGYLTKKNYNKSIEIDEINQYTVLKFPIHSESLIKMTKKCLKNILKSKKILLNNKPIDIKDCVIVDIVNTSTSTFAGYHTDVEYSNFTGNAFNVWYLIENNEKYGNMFLLESDEYKKSYTPCCFDYNYKDNLIPLIKTSYLDFLTSLKITHLAYLNKDDVKVTYTNIKNGECLVMSKHVLHGGDLKRDNNVKGFNFRVLIKNKDGSINYNNCYKNTDKFPKHNWDKINKKLYGVDLFDFVI